MPPRTRRELTPGAHARIRLHLALIPAYICLVSGWIDLVSRLPIGPGSEAHRVRDFAGIAYIPGLIANQGDASALYDSDRRATMLRALLPNGPNVRYPPFYGPQISVFFSPLARLPYEWALAAWMAITCAVYLACGYAVGRTCPRLRDRAGAVLVLLLADPTLYYTLSFVQISAIALVCATGAFLALRANRPFLAGVAIGSLVYKPSLGVAFAVVFACSALAEMLAKPKLARDVGERMLAKPKLARDVGERMLAKPKLARDSDERRLVVGAILGAAAQVAVGALFWGPSIVGDYVRTQIRLIPDMRDEFYIHHLHSWRGFFEILGLPNAVAQTAYLIVGAAVLFAAWRCWQSAAPLQVRFAVLLIATVLVNPHGYVYDAIILMPAYLLLWDWAEQQPPPPFGKKIEWVIYLCYLSPLFAIVALVARVQLSVAALTVLLLAPQMSMRTAAASRTTRRNPMDV